MALGVYACSHDVYVIIGPLGQVDQENPTQQDAAVYLGIYYLGEWFVGRVRRGGGGAWRPDHREAIVGSDLTTTAVAWSPHPLQIQRSSHGSCAEHSRGDIAAGQGPITNGIFARPPHCATLGPRVINTTLRYEWNARLRM